MWWDRQRLLGGALKAVAVVVASLLVGGGAGWAIGALLNGGEESLPALPERPGSTQTQTQAATTPTPAAEREKLLFVGDTLLGGYGATSAKKAYRARVIKALGGDARVKAVDAHPEGNPKQIRASSFARIPRRPTLAVVEVGTSDWRRTPPRSFAGDYRRLIQTVRRSSAPDVRLVCLGVWRPGDAAETKALDAAIRKGCTRGGYIELSGLFDAGTRYRAPGAEQVVGGRRTTFSPPNDHGHAAIAKAIVRALKR
jgi:hypothetical protein